MTNSSNRTLERIARRVPVPEPAYDRLLRRRDRKVRNRRLSAAALAIIVSLVSFAALTRAFSTADRPADEPVSQDIFAEVHGWIAYGSPNGIWAVDPAHPGDPSNRVQLSPREGEPVAWSSDGSKLLILRHVDNARPGRVNGSDLFVLHADGAESRVTNAHGWVSGGSFSPDGSEIVYAADRHDMNGRLRLSGVYVIDTEGGPPRLLLNSNRRLFPVDGTRHTSLYAPTFSPDGTQIAYFNGMGDWGHSLRVMNADGTDSRVLVDEEIQDGGHIFGLAWSPDGHHLAFGFRGYGVFVVEADGSGLTLAIPEGLNPYWSPDGSRISYQHQEVRSGVIIGMPGALRIAAADGTQVVEFGYARSGPWHPLEPVESGER